VAADDAAKVQAEVDGLKGCMQRLEAEAVAASQELLTVRKDAELKVIRW
jgi:hypothetical protein